MVNFLEEVVNLENIFNIRDTDILKIQINEEDNVKVFGSLDGENYYILMGIKDDNLNPVKEIISSGTYTYDINGFEKIKITKEKEDTLVRIVGVN